jgi:hypothetical protein
MDDLHSVQLANRLLSITLEAAWNTTFEFRPSLLHLQGYLVSVSSSTK